MNRKNIAINPIIKGIFFNLGAKIANTNPAFLLAVEKADANKVREF